MRVAKLTTLATPQTLPNQWQRTNDNDTDGADKRHQKWGIGLCALRDLLFHRIFR